MTDRADLQVLRRQIDDARGDKSAMAAALDELAGQAAAGDLTGLDELLTVIDAHGLARTPIRRVVMDTPTVEDVCQDVLIAVAERITTFDGRSRFTTWLHTLARNKAIDTLRRHRPAVPLDEEVDVELSDQARLSSVIATQETIMAVLDTLPQEYRGPVVMRDLQQRPYDEIAQSLEVSPGAARTRVSRGRAMVAARLQTAG